MRPAVLSYSENHEKVYPLTGSKTAAGLTINYRMQIKSGLLAEKTCTVFQKQWLCNNRKRKPDFETGEKVFFILWRKNIADF